MNLQAEDEKLMVSYLLGELRGRQLIDLEEQYFTDNDFFERMLAVRDELIDNYLRNELSPPQCERFELYFMASPQRREQVELARGLMQSLVTDPVAEPPAAARARDQLASWWEKLRAFLNSHRLAWPLAVAALLLLVVGGYALRLRQQLEQTQAEHATLRGHRQKLEQQLAEQRARDGEPSRAMNQDHPSQPEPNNSRRPAPSLFTLMPDLERDLRMGGGRREQLIIQPGADLVGLRLKLVGDRFNSYRAVLRAVSSGEEVWQQTSLKPQGQVVVVKLPARTFAGGAKDYILTLSGLTSAGKYEDGDKYSFQVDKK